MKFNAQSVNFKISHTRPLLFQDLDPPLIYFLASYTNDYVATQGHGLSVHVSTQGVKDGLYGLPAIQVGRAVGRAVREQGGVPEG